MKSKRRFLSDLASARRALAAWRRTHPPRSAIPEPLWAQAATLARIHGVSRVAQTLRLNYYALQRRIQVQPPVAHFVEVPWPPLVAGPQGCTAELADRQGRKLVLRWSAAPGPELLALVQAFWRPEV